MQSETGAITRCDLSHYHEASKQMLCEQHSRLVPNMNIPIFGIDEIVCNSTLKSVKVINVLPERK